MSTLLRSEPDKRQAFSSPAHTVKGLQRAGLERPYHLQAPCVYLRARDASVSL